MKWKEVESNVKKANNSVTRRIEFRLSSKPLFPVTETMLSNHKNGSNGSSTSHVKDTVIEDEISGPVPGLCHPQLIVPFIKWNKIYRNAPGLFNQGNTCYLNSTLQCLLHLPIFTQYILHDESSIDESNKSDSANHHNNTIFNIFQKLVKEIWITNTSKAISPRAIVQNIRRIGKLLRPMRQEDAHEFLRLLLDCIHEEILKSKGLKSNQSIHGKVIYTTLISRIFGGYLRNELSCSECSFKSRSFNHFHDLCLDINRVTSIEESIKAFTKPEILDKGNEWKCDKCNKKVKATKQLTISRGPMVLVIQLKRFSFGNFGGKICKHITFPLELKISLSDDEDKAESAVYELAGVVVHHGASVHSGHYIAYVKAPSGQWLEMNDSTVSVCSVQRVLAVQAYMLFYCRTLTASSKLHTKAHTSPPTSSTNDTTPQSNAYTVLMPQQATTMVEEVVSESPASLFSLTRLLYDGPTRLRPVCPWMLAPMRFKGRVFWSWKPNNMPLRKDPVKDTTACSLTESIPELSEELISDIAVIPLNADNDMLASGVSNSIAEVETKPSMIRQLLNVSKRGRDIETEGTWDDVPQSVLEERKALIPKDRMSRKELVQRDWDRQLDQGRMKKVKTKKDLNEIFNGKNHFQDYSEKKKKEKYSPQW